MKRSASEVFNQEQEKQRRIYDWRNRTAKTMESVDGATELLAWMMAIWFVAVIVMSLLRTRK